MTAPRVDNRVSAYGYDWRDRETYAVSPLDAAGVTYTMTTYDNLDEATESQQYSYKGSESNGIPTPLAAATADPPAPLDPADNDSDDDVLLSQSTSAYDSLGQVYQASTYQVVSGAVVSAETQTTNYWYDADGNEVAMEDPAQNGTTWRTTARARSRKAPRGR